MGHAMEKRYVKQFCQMVFAVLLLVGAFQPVSATELGDTDVTETEEIAGDSLQDTEENFDVPAVSSEPVSSPEPLPSISPEVTETPVPSTEPDDNQNNTFVVEYWSIDSDVLVFENGQYVLNLSASIDSPVTKDIVSSMLPSHVLIQDGSAVPVTWDYSQIPEEGITDGGTYVITGTLQNGYLMSESAVPLEVQIITAEAEVYAQDNIENHIISTVSPAHVKFNLFDYTYRENTDGTFTLNYKVPFQFTSTETGKGPWNYWTGDNSHPFSTDASDGLKYGIYPGIVSEKLGTDGFPQLELSDDYTKYDNKITDRGFYNNTVNKSGMSLAYLFNPANTDLVSGARSVYKNVQGLLKYDGNGGYEYNSHENYVVYRDTENIGANGETSDGYFDVYDNWAVKGSSSPNGMFFPFDDTSRVFENNNGSYSVGDDGKLVPKNQNFSQIGGFNYLFGLSMETIFLQPEDGKIDANTPMYFTFSGDDDVWVYIDGVLVSDIGGIHDECFTIIDFETGNVYTGLTPMRLENGQYLEDTPELSELRNETQNGSTNDQWTWVDHATKAEKTGTFEEYKTAHGIKETTLKDIFTNADEADGQEWGTGDMSNTFDKNTQHELKLFYLERGQGASNLVMKFNMLAVPASGITKTDQDGRPVQGAEFALWPAKTNENGEVIVENGSYIADKGSDDPIAQGVTDENGHLNFISETRKIITFQELAEDGKLYFVLEEVKTPPGYRSNGNVSLYYRKQNDSSNIGVIQSYNYWKTGAYAQAKLTVTLTSNLYKYKDGENGGPPVVGEKIANPDNGIIFAVAVMCDEGGSIYDQKDLHALYGTPNAGWTILNDDITDMNSVLDAARNQERLIQETRQTSTIVASKNARDLYEIEVENIPGKVEESYPFNIDKENAEDSKYNVAFYYAEGATSLDDVDPENIVRLATQTPNEAKFQRQYSVQIYVTNVLNRIRVQKTDWQGNRIDGAEFKLYQLSSKVEHEGYINQSDGSWKNGALYNNDGTLKSYDQILTTTAWDTNKTQKASEDAGKGALKIDGAMLFPSKLDDYIRSGSSDAYQVNEHDTSTYLEEGEYIILESEPPDGYTTNKSIIHVYVDETGVYADAGEIGDGVRVGQYAGWMFNSMTQFAAEDAVDETLTFIRSTLQVKEDINSEEIKSPIEGRITWQNKYSNQDDRYIFLAEDVGKYITEGSNLYQFTDQDIPLLDLEQNNNVTAQTLIFSGTVSINGTDVDLDHYSGPVTVYKKAGNETISMEGYATDGTLGFWLARTPEQTLDRVEIGGKNLEKDNNYYVYTPNVDDLSNTDISGLFATETLVQVADQGTGTVNVTKELEDVVENSPEKDTPFFFTISGQYDQVTQLRLVNESNEKAAFDGTLNVRLRNKTVTDQSSQNTATTIPVSFKNGEANIYLDPGYEVEHVYIPENEDHGASKLKGQLYLQIQLNEQSSGTFNVKLKHLVDGSEKTVSANFENGKAEIWYDPVYQVESVKDQFNTLTIESVTSRFNSIAFSDVQNQANLDGKADLSFTGSSSVITETDTNLGSYVDVRNDGNTGYQLSFSADNNATTAQASFALYGGQSVAIHGLPAGMTYHVYEYGAETGEKESNPLTDKWVTTVKDENGATSEEYEGYQSTTGTIKAPDTQTLTFTNKLKTGSVSVNKVVGGNAATDDDKTTKEYEFEIRFDYQNSTLTGKYPYTISADGKEPASGTLELVDGTGTFKLMNGETILINKLPINVTYTISETNSEGFNVLVNPDEDGDGLAEGTITGVNAEITFSNLKYSGDLIFYKVAVEDYTHKLSGASFKLLKLICTNSNHNHDDEIVDANDFDQTCWQISGKYSSQQDGKVEFKQLYQNSEYRLIETAAPDGRITPKGQWRITTDPEGKITITPIAADGENSPVFVTDKDGNLLLPNTKAFDLPSSGMAGPTCYLRIGALLMSGAIALLLISRKKRDKS